MLNKVGFILVGVGVIATCIFRPLKKKNIMKILFSVHFTKKHSNG